MTRLHHQTCAMSGPVGVCTTSAHKIVITCGDRVPTTRAPHSQTCAFPQMQMSSWNGRSASTKAALLRQALSVRHTWGHHGTGEMAYVIRRNRMAEFELLKSRLGICAIIETRRYILPVIVGRFLPRAKICQYIRKSHSEAHCHTEVSDQFEGTLQLSVRESVLSGPPTLSAGGMTMANTPYFRSVSRDSA